jgi:hypothetical protein
MTGVCFAELDKSVSEFALEGVRDLMYESRFLLLPICFSERSRAEGMVAPWDLGLLMTGVCFAELDKSVSEFALEAVRVLMIETRFFLSSLCFSERSKAEVMIAPEAAGVPMTGLSFAELDKSVSGFALEAVRVLMIETLFLLSSVCFSE